MALTYGFFDAQLDTEGNYDRIYSAEQFAEYFHLIVANGVFPDPATQLQVVSSVPASMTVEVSSGFGWINGYYANNSSEHTLNIAVADSVFPRIDAVVLRWVNSTRAMEFDVLTGTPNSTPTVPALTRSSDVYELMLAKIMVDAGATSISQSAITDTRADTSVCGWVTGAVQNIDATNLFAQFETAFYEWFDDVKTSLEGDIATNLLNRIIKLEDALGDYIPTIQKGAADGVATLGSNGLIPITQIPTLSYIPSSEKGAAGGTATLGSDGKVPSSQLPSMDYIPTSEKGTADGVATLGTDRKVPGKQLPSVLSKSELVSYPGSGTSGERGKTSIGPFSFEPKVVFVLSHLTTAFFPIWRTSGTERQTIVHFPYETSVTPVGNNSYHIPISYSIVKKADGYYLQAFNVLDGGNAAEFQFNGSETAYTAIAIG